MTQELVRNFSIIAHIDHGKSTLADRLLELTNSLSERERRDQFLDNMELERERGITIKAQAVRLRYPARDGRTYTMNLIDTPGHVDFNYEVSRSLAACEGALLVVDATQGVEAQTVANVYLAIENDLEIIPVINKIDLPSADVDRAREEVEDVIGIDATDAVACSGKTGVGVLDVLEAIAMRVPPPTGDPNAPLQALIFDSWFDAYRGVTTMVRVVHGRVRKGDLIRLMATRAEAEVQQVGVFAPFSTPVDELAAGDVGFVVSGIKEVRHTKIGDTITHAHRPAPERLAGFQDVKPNVFCGIFPIDSKDYDELRDALEKLQLNDAALSWEPETSQALGFGFRCGFLGLLHMEIVQERLEREYDLDLISTAPTVVYRVETNAGEELMVENPSRLPDPVDIASFDEPWIRAQIHVSPEFVGAVIALCEERRGRQTDIGYLGTRRMQLRYELPLAEIVFDFFDRLKSVSKGYASFDYEMLGYRPGTLVRLDVLVNGEPVDALSIITHRDTAYHRGRALCAKLKELIPRQQFEVPIQAAIGTKVIARETIRGVRKNVLAKCYGGDITRKRKLLEKQKEGKKRMKQIGSVEIPQEAFLAVLKVND
ncbi:MAG: elongation factor 4 [Myxococcales bacterium]|nr:elongation factor 4 [Myxococcales bacterium]MCB9531059.1 elongation factor 4 [Myxococcales bacterium]MCB9532969.1 elongation factor 4 [Myxococcales bacterium]